MASDPRDEVEIIAHRGYSAQAPENTLAAVRRAIEAGADAVEWDVHVASCGTPVLFHDVALGRTTTGVGPVRRRTLGQLQALDAGSWFSPDFAGERIPSLAEALEATKGRVLRMYTEVKGYRELEDLDRMVSIVRQADALADTVFISLDWGILDRIRGQEPSVALGFVVEEEARFEEAVRRVLDDGNAFVDASHRLLLDRPELATSARQRGVALGAWTVDDPEEATALLELGVRGFTTNEVERLLAWRDG